MSITDAEIKEKLLFFARTVGSPESHSKVNNNTWLEKFKQKNGLSGSKSRKSSVAEESEAASTTCSANRSPNVSPTSPDLPAQRSPSAMSITQDEKPPQSAVTERTEDSYVDFGSGSHKPHQSLGGPFTEAPASYATGTTHHSTSPFFPEASGFAAPPPPPRQRSSTFPVVGLEFGGSQAPASSGSGVLDTPSDASSAIPLSAEAVLPPTTSSSSISTPHTAVKTESSPISPASSVGTSPTPDDTRRALEVVMNFFQHQSAGLEPQEFILIGKLMEKLKVQCSRSGEMPGGMYRLAELPFGTRAE